MLSVLPASVMLIGLLGMFVITFAVTRMAILERKVHRPAFREPSARPFVGSGV